MKNSRLALGAIALMVAMGSVAEEPNPYQALIDNSPFLTPAFKARLGQRDAVAISFIGYTRIAEEWFFALYERKTDKAHWLKMNEEKDGIKIESFEEKTQKIQLTVGGIGVELTLEKESR